MNQASMEKWVLLLKKLQKYQCTIQYTEIESLPPSSTRNYVDFSALQVKTWVTYKHFKIGYIDINSVISHIIILINLSTTDNGNK